MMRCMSSARLMTPSSATDFWAEITSSRPGRRVYQPLARRRVAGTTDAEQSLVLLVGAGADQAERMRAVSAPPKRRLAPGAVVGKGLAGVVVALGEHGPAVVL